MLKVGELLIYEDNDDCILCKVGIIEDGGWVDIKYLHNFKKPEELYNDDHWNYVDLSGDNVPGFVKYDKWKVDKEVKEWLGE